MPPSCSTTTQIIMLDILVTGANGQLGNEMRLLGAASENRYRYTDVAELDITDADAVERYFAANKTDVIVNCAAYTNVDRAEDDEAAARRINRDAVRNLADSARRHNATLIHVSTDYVFDGTGNTPLREDDSTSPTGIYGITKLDGEKAIAESGCRALILRTAWLYSSFGNNFVKTMIRLTSERDRLNVVFDQVGSPTYAADLAKTIFDIIETGAYIGNEGVYHYSDEGVCSWYDFAKVIAEMYGNTGCDIRPCHSEEFPSKVKRPSYSVLDKTKIKQRFGITVPYWVDSLRKCIEKLKLQQTETSK